MKSEFEIRARIGQLIAERTKLMQELGRDVCAPAAVTSAATIDQIDALITELKWVISENDING